jgi:hypothetical protein
MTPTPATVSEIPVFLNVRFHCPICASLSPATLDEHQADTFGEHVFVNVLSP